MLFAKVAFDIAVFELFDYLVPPELERDCALGKRALVTLKGKKTVGIIAGLKPSSKIKKAKPIIEIIDRYPVIEKDIFRLCQEISDYYCSALGQALAASLPKELRAKKKIDLIPPNPELPKTAKRSLEFVYNLNSLERLKIYTAIINETLSNGNSAILLMPDKQGVLRAIEFLKNQIRQPLISLVRNDPAELTNWLCARQAKNILAVATRSGVFAPLHDLGLLIIEDEANTVYKQEQSPHYHSREAALMRSKIQGCKVVLGGYLPSLESLHLASRSKKECRYPQIISPAGEIKVIDMKGVPSLNRKRRIILSQYLTDAVAAALNEKKKVFIFLNRRGFATYAYCQTCAKNMSCPRCNLNLIYYFKGAYLACSRCNYKIKVPDICPNCQVGYIKFSGLGIEKLESELSRIYPQARIKRIEKKLDLELSQTDITLSTQPLDARNQAGFELVVCLSPDNMLNRVDLRAAERTFSFLCRLYSSAKEKFIIQTNIPQHYCFVALKENNTGLFFSRELKVRRHLKFPPFSHFCSLKVRSPKEERVSEASENIVKELISQGNNFEVYASLQTEKLRGRYLRQIMLRTKSAPRLSLFLKRFLKNFPHSGIIISIDMDPL